MKFTGGIEIFVSLKWWGKTEHPLEDRVNVQNLYFYDLKCINLC